MFAVPCQSWEAFGRDQRAVDSQLLVPVPFRPESDVLMEAFSCGNQWREKLDPSSRVTFLYSPDHFVGMKRLDRHSTVGTVLPPHFGKQQPEVMVDLRHCRHGRVATASAASLFYRHGRRDSFNMIDIRPSQLFHVLLCIRRETVEVAPLSLREEHVEDETRFARPADSRYDHHLVARHTDVYCLEVVMPGLHYLDCVVISVFAS